jgi:hypothetical protein
VTEVVGVFVRFRAPLHPLKQKINRLLRQFQRKRV